MPHKENLSTDEAADYLGLSSSYLNKLRCLGGGPRYAKIGRRVLYPLADLNRWLRDQSRVSTSDDGGIYT